MKLLQKLRVQAKALKRELTAVYYASQDSRVGLIPKILIVLAIGYTLSPVDLIPDFIPILGLLDDLLLVPALLTLAIRLIPSEVMEAARRKAESEPLTLKKNWFFAVAFIAIWTVLLLLLTAWVWGLVIEVRTLRE